MPDDFERLPCGCVMGSIGDAFVYIPCSVLCKFYLHAVDLAKQAGKPIETHIMKG